MSNSDVPELQKSLDVRPDAAPLPEPMGRPAPEGSSWLNTTKTVAGGLALGGTLALVPILAASGTRSSRPAPPTTLGQVLFDLLTIPLKALVVTPCVGATRSSRLVCEHNRQAAVETITRIEAELAQQKSDHQPRVESSAEPAE